MVTGKQMNIPNTLTVNIACFRNLTLAIYSCFVLGERWWMVVVIVAVVVMGRRGGGLGRTQRDDNLWTGEKERQKGGGFLSKQSFAPL